MASPLKQLPWELKEEILSRLPPQTLLRWRSVCKQWNSLFNDKSFLKTHSSRSPPQFIVVTASKVYSIDIIGSDPNTFDPNIELCELPSSSGIPFDDIKGANITTCDEFLFLFCNNNWHWTNKAALLNPWLRQVTWIDHQFKVVGLGYDNSRSEKVYKMLVWYLGDHGHQRLATYECASQALKSIDTPDHNWPKRTERQVYVSLNGNLYWVDYNVKTREYFIQSFDFSSESFKPLCLLPCQDNRGSDKLADKLLLAVFEGDRFSMLKLRNKPRNIGLWVTKKRIRSYNNGGDGEGVVWINLMTFSSTNLRTLFPVFGRRPISYFIYNKTIFICCGGNGTGGVACIYVVKKDHCKKIPIAFGLDNFCHCVYAPNLMSLPSLI